MAKQIHLRLDDSLFEALSDYGATTGISVNDFISSSIMQSLSNQLQTEKHDAEFTFIDLFAGIGGMRLAFENNGGDCVYSNEWNKYSQQTYFANFGEQPDGDITKVDARIIPNHDILVAGFPCQPFSIAGVSKKQSLGRATGFEDKTQGTLFFDVCRIIKAKRPKAFMLENVKNLKSHDKGNTFKVIMESLDELDYEVFYAILDGQNYVPQHRERILIVGFDRQRYGKEIDFQFDISPVEPKPLMKDILEEVTVLTGAGEVKVLPASELELGYRTSIVKKEGYLVLEAVLSLEEGEPAQIQKRMNELKEQRVSKQPLEFPCAGSTFKRPEGYFAGKLIMDAGLAGYQIGGAQVSAKHCGFLINAGNATARDVYRLIRFVQKTVWDKFQVELETEVKMLGRFEDED